ncbi:single-stranded DNA-binding protein [Autumnicola musiva]|uniref:Single-stranded DNA-binding protein n=1 Tax=Autumnicola musiva TaxID=3075589 RepID=A0ABU3DAA7_9FLAO|nr:single-stranded DNA-binding protein [Zunongwangia sp. F117]MDT0678472.1 single-stranded DNA-binding protein [Zunongwangia sp. F117]
MNTLRNHVQFSGNVGGEPQITNFESGKKVARFSLATNEFYKNDQGERIQITDWHTIVAWGKTADIIEKYAGKGKEIGVTGKLKPRSYEDKDGVKHYATEVEANEILLLGTKNGNNSAE